MHHKQIILEIARGIGVALLIIVILLLLSTLIGLSSDPETLTDITSSISRNIPWK